MEWTPQAGQPWPQQLMTPLPPSDDRPRVGKPSRPQKRGHSWGGRVPLAHRAVRILAWLLLLHLSSIQLAWAQPSEPVPDGAEQAAEIEGAVEESMRKGLQALAQDDLASALEHFTAAWQLRQYGIVAASLAEVEMKLGRYLEAAEHWEYYRAAIPADQEDKRRKVDAALTECRSQLGRVRVTTTPPDATLSLDGRSLGQASKNQDLWVYPGEHELFATLEGRRSPPHRLRAEKGEARSIELRVPSGVVEPGSRSPAFREASSTPVTDSGRSPARTVVVFGGGGLAVVGLALGTGYAVHAHRSAEAADTLLARTKRANDPLAARDAQCIPEAPDRPAQCDDLDAKMDDVERSRRIAAAAFVSSGVVALGVAATYFLWPRQRAQARLTVTPWVARGARGATLEGSF